MGDKSKTARRAFLTRLGQSAAMAATGGLVWAYLVEQQARAAYNVIRPPGAREAADFYAKCIKCGRCVRDCPYDTLKLAKAGDRVPIGTPYFTPREIPCYMCPDIPCKAACPTGALDPALADIDDSRMGLAVIDIENCLSWQGLRCEICFRDCPLQGSAIVVETVPRKLSKHAMFVPIVNSDHCTGCGICEKACPTDQAAIRVVLPELVQGEIGKHYRLGWKREDRITQEFQPWRGDVPADGGGGEAGGIDYLNRDDGF